MKKIYPVITILLLASFAHGQELIEKFRNKVNGNVYAVLADEPNNLIYLGGDFTAAGDLAHYGVTLDPITGEFPLTYPQPNGSVWTSIPDGNGGFYIGGDFTMVGDSMRIRLAQINASGEVTGWNPEADNLVRALVLADGVVYVGGNFTSIGGQSRNRIAAIDAITGNIIPWNPNANGQVWSLAVSEDLVYAGGLYWSIKESVSRGFSALNLKIFHTLTYSSSANGSLIGEYNQTVESGGNGTAVEAVPDKGYHFVQWSDGLTDNPRTDENVNMGINITAEFAINTYTAVSIQWKKPGTTL